MAPEEVSAVEEDEGEGLRGFFDRHEEIAQALATRQQYRTVKALILVRFAHDLLAAVLRYVETGDLPEREEE